MYQKKQYIQNVILLFTDMLAVICSYFMAAFFWTGFIRKLDVMEFAETKERFGMVLIAFAVVYMVFNTNRKFIERKIFEEFVQCIKLNILFAAAYAIMLFIGDSFDTASRGVYICTVVFNIFLMFFFRILVRIYLVKIYKNHKKTSQLFIITTSGNIENVIDNMKRNVEWTNRISGKQSVRISYPGISEYRIEGFHQHGQPYSEQHKPYQRASVHSGHVWHSGGRDTANDEECSGYGICHR